MDVKKATEENEMSNGDLLGHYSSEVCSHLEGVIALFFSLLGILIMMTTTESFLGKALFSAVYFTLGFLALYFYVRLFYYRKMLEEIILEKPYRKSHLKLEKRVLGQSRLIKWMHSLSRSKKGEYNLRWAWLMLTVTVLVATLCWTTVFFSL